MKNLTNNSKAITIVDEHPKQSGPLGIVLPIKVRYNIWHFNVGNLSHSKIKTFLKQSKHICQIKTLLDSDYTEFITPFDLFIPSDSTRIETIEMDPTTDALHITVGVEHLTHKRAEDYLKELLVEYKSEQDQSLGICKYFFGDDSSKFIKVTKIERGGII